MKKWQTLTPAQRFIIEHKGTEPPFSGQFLDGNAQGTYLCRGCGQALFRGNQQFSSHCGWPSFDEQIAGTIDFVPDSDGQREEIICHQCCGHLGHIFYGEALTNKNARYCVNALSIEFISDQTALTTEEIILSCGCFWGVQRYFAQLPGVLKTEVGYTGGHTEYPKYEQVCAKNTGHLEAIRIVFDSAQISVQTLLQKFFEIHDFTQHDGQGPDKGSQYLSAIYYLSPEQHKIAENLKQKLEQKGLSVVTTILPAVIFWKAEEYHQDYYLKNELHPK